MKKFVSVFLAFILVFALPMSVGAASAYGSYTAEDTAAVKKMFSGWYTNETVVVKIDQMCDQGKATGVYFKPDLSKLNTDTLVFYNYNKAENTVKKIEKPNYSVNAEGYLTFYTDSNQGFVVIADSAWTKEAAKTTTAGGTGLSSGSSSSSASTATSTTTIKSGTTSSSSTPGANATVYYTATGKKYHNENPCGNGTYYACTLEQAKAKGLTACEKCVLK